MVSEKVEQERQREDVYCSAKKNQNLQKKRQLSHLMITGMSTQDDTMDSIKYHARLNIYIYIYFVLTMHQMTKDISKLCGKLKMERPRKANTHVSVDRS